MKTIKILSVISFVLIILAATAGKPNQLNKVAPPASSEFVKYKVTLHVDKPLVLALSQFYVVITDETGQRVAEPAKVGREKIFFFSEKGPVKGTRIATLIQVPEEGAYIPFYCNPDSKTGGFKNGVTYNFNLYPSLQLPY